MHTCAHACSNAAYQASLAQLGARVGLVAQNTSLLDKMMRYHVLPVALTAAQLGQLNKTRTLANEALFIHTARKCAGARAAAMHAMRAACRCSMHAAAACAHAACAVSVAHSRRLTTYARFCLPPCSGTVEVYSNPKVKTALQLIDIRAGGCWIHTIDAVIPPPSLLPTIEAWIVEAGHPVPQLAREEWAPVQEPLPAAGSAGEQPAAGAAGAPLSPVPSSGGGICMHGSSRRAGLVLLPAALLTVALL